MRWGRAALRYGARRCGASRCSASSPGAWAARPGPAAGPLHHRVRPPAAATGIEESIAPAGGWPRCRRGSAPSHTHCKWGAEGGRWERGAAPAAQRLRSSAAPLHGARLVPLLEVENRSCCWEKRWAALGLAASRVVGLSREMESVRPKSRQPSRIGLTKSFNLVLLCRSAPSGLLLSDWNPSRRSPAVLIVKDAVGPCLFFFFPYLQRKNGVPSR